MQLPKTFSFLGVSLATLLALAAGPVNANGIFFEHNGYDINVPENIFNGTGTGTGAVDVDFGCAIDFEGLFCLKDFYEVATHTISLGAESYGSTFDVPIIELVLNDTSVTWFDYHIELEGVTFDDFYVDCEFGECDEEGITVEISDDYTTAWLFFEDGLSSGDAFAIFAVLEFEFHGQSAITISQTPTVPEPATLLLLGLGLAGLGFVRKPRH